ncbi:hypothetical protein K435DRAFT_88820 [Dendrothele bispora CBS 962.96]|uniref:Uncharacterized protein n=1 Tax=Dendrothele bispora (strain CBS 962.96) TaxID=1314807 RepID=A0A4S8M4N3_DENBC|nr:hypothetical protein K435DRAFT_88820 [Dendrothele bispora CBS 962.96]
MSTPMSVSESGPSTVAAVLALKADVEQSPEAKSNDGRTRKTGENEAQGEAGGDSTSFPKFDDMTFVQIGLILFSLGLAPFLFAMGMVG